MKQNNTNKFPLFFKSIPKKMPAKFHKYYEFDKNHQKYAFYYDQIQLSDLLEFASCLDNINNYDTQGATAIMRACESGSIGFINKFLKIGANPKKRVQGTGIDALQVLILQLTGKNAFRIIDIDKFVMPKRYSKLVELFKQEDCQDDINKVYTNIEFGLYSGYYFANANIRCFPYDILGILTP